MYSYHVNNGQEKRLFSLLKTKNVNSIKSFLQEINSRRISQEVKLPLLLLALEIDDNSEIFFLLFNRLMILDQQTILQLLNLWKYRVRVSDYNFLKCFYANPYSSSINLMEVNDKGYTIFDYALEHLKIKAVKVLLTYFFLNSVNDIDRENSMKILFNSFMRYLNLLLSLKVSSSDIIYMYSLFIDNGIDVNATDMFNETFIQKVLKNDTYSFDGKQMLINFALTNNHTIFSEDGKGEIGLSLTSINNPRIFDLFFTNEHTIKEFIHHKLEIYLYLYYRSKIMAVDNQEDNNEAMNIDDDHSNIHEIVCQMNDTLTTDNIYSFIQSRPIIDIDLLLILSILFDTNDNVIAKAFLENPLKFKVLKGNNEWQALNCACQYGNTDMVIAFLKINASLKIQNNKKDTPLIVACKSKSMDIINLLLGSGIPKKDIDLSLIIACQKSQYEIVKLLLKNHADVNTTDDNEKTPLIKACENNDLEMVNILLNANANTERKDKFGNSALITACHKVNIPMMEALLKKGANVNIFDDKKRTPLIWACLKKNYEMVQFLLQYSVNINYKCFNGNTPLIITCFTDQLEVAMDLLNRKEIQINLSNQRKNTPLITASECGNLSIVQELLNRKASINDKNKFGNTALMAAIEKDQTAVAELLLDHQSSINDRNRDGETALFIACRKNNQKLVERLIEQGADLNGKNSNLKSVLMQACENENMSLIEYLIQHQANINKVYGMWNETAFMTACKCNNMDLMKLFLNYDVDVNLTSWYGKNSLMYLCENGLCEQAKLIIEKIKDINARDRNNNTALSLACMNNHLSCVNLLISYGADYDFQNNDGNTPLHLACQNGGIDIVKMLMEHQVKMNVQNKTGDTPLLIAAQQNGDETLSMLLMNYPEIDFNLFNNSNENVLDILFQKDDLKKLEILISYDLEQHRLIHIFEDLLDKFLYSQDFMDMIPSIKLTILKTIFKYLSHDKNYKFGEKLLQIFVQLDSLEEVQYIFEHEECNANYVDSTTGLSSLTIATLNNNIRMVQYLLEKGANVNQLSPDGDENLLMMASRHGYDKVLNALLSYHPDINEVNRNGETALCLAVKNDHTRCAESLLMYYANPNLSDHNQCSPLLYACRNRNVRLVEFLLRHHADPEVKNSQGETPLMAASVVGSDDLVKKLQKTGVNINEVNDDMDTALLLACKYKQYTVVNTLLFFNADIYLTNRDGKNALYYAQLDAQLSKVFQTYHSI